MSAGVAMKPSSFTCRGKGKFTNSQTRPLHAKEENQTREGTSPQPPQRMEIVMKRLAYYDKLPNIQDTGCAPRGREIAFLEA